MKSKRWFEYCVTVVHGSSRRGVTELENSTMHDENLSISKNVRIAISFLETEWMNVNMNI